MPGPRLACGLSFAKIAYGDISLRFNAFITVMQAAELWDRNDPSDTRDLPRKGTLLGQPQMRPRPVVVSEIRGQGSPQMPIRAWTACVPTHVFRTCCGVSAFPYATRSLPEGGQGGVSEIAVGAAKFPSKNLSVPDLSRYRTSALERFHLSGWAPTLSLARQDCYKCSPQNGAILPNAVAYRKSLRAVGMKLSQQHESWRIGHIMSPVVEVE